MRTIVLTGGGTIGHTAPHFAIIPYLNFDKIYYIGSKTGIEKNFVLSKGLDYFEIEPCKLKRSLSFSNLKIPFTFKKSVKDAKEILKELNPLVVFSKGGYVGLPVTVASKKLNIPVIIHESDLSLGLANKIASKFSTKTLTSFEKTAYSVKNGEYVGSPIREELFSKSKLEAFNYYNISSDKPVLLVTGGSSGAKAINKLVLSSLPKLLKYFTVLHVVGKGNLSNKKIKGYYEIEFTDMSYAYKVADVCLSRAGSNTAFELIANKIPTLFIPLPKTESRGDQIENAKYFKSLNLADYIYQENLDENTLTNKLLKVYANRNYFMDNFKNYNLKIGNKIIAEILNKY